MSNRFVGSKGGSGVAEWLITAMPMHKVYVEAFAGRAVVGLKKRQAYYTYFLEKDRLTAAALKLKAPRGVNVHDVDGIDFVNWWKNAGKITSDWLIYFDPPYLMDVRSSKREYYEEEFHTEADHNRLLDLALALPCMVMISGYWSELYAKRLASWRMETFWTIDRRGNRKEECCWMNFPLPTVLHDARFVGGDFTNRQRIKRKVERWKNKFLAMPAGERQAVFEALQGSLVS